MLLTTAEDVESLNEGAEQGFDAAACVMRELEETEIKRQLVLRDAKVGAQPGSQQRPKALDCVDLDLAKAIPIFVARTIAKIYIDLCAASA